MLLEKYEKIVIKSVIYYLLLLYDVIDHNANNENVLFDFSSCPSEPLVFALDVCPVSVPPGDKL